MHNRDVHDESASELLAINCSPVILPNNPRIQPSRCAKSNICSPKGNVGIEASRDHMSTSQAAIRQQHHSRLQAPNLLIDAHNGLENPPQDHQSPGALAAKTVSASNTMLHHNRRSASRHAKGRSKHAPRTARNHNRPSEGANRQPIRQVPVQG
jgi:hypothetical protein